MHPYCSWLWPDHDHRFHWYAVYLSTAPPLTLDVACTLSNVIWMAFQSLASLFIRTRSNLTSKLAGTATVFAPLNLFLLLSNAYQMPGSQISIVFTIRSRKCSTSLLTNSWVVLGWTASPLRPLRHHTESIKKNGRIFTKAANEPKLNYILE